MRYTSAQAAKLLKRLNDEKDVLDADENLASVYHAAVGEDAEKLRPAYDYAAVQETRRALDKKIRLVKHAINEFNITHDVPGFAMTVDQLLVYMPQINQRRQRLFNMQNRLPRQRETCVGPGVIDYSYANYDVATAQRDYLAACDELSRAQTALDELNSNAADIELDI